jgi:hypothetical protein
MRRIICFYNRSFFFIIHRSRHRSKIHKSFLSVDFRFRFLFDHLRKAMHFTEFFLLAIGTVSFFAHRRQFSLIRLGVMLLSGPTVAFLDEGIQLFSEGRVFSTVDVGIDSLGYFSCILVYMSLALLRRAISRKGDAH